MKPIAVLTLFVVAVAANRNYGQTEFRVQSYDNAPALRTSSYEAPVLKSSYESARVVDVPSVRVELSSSDYQAPALRSNYEAPAIRSSYEAPAIRSTYEAPATRLVDVAPVRVELSSSDYQAPAPIRSSYEAPAVRSSYDTQRVVDVPSVRVELSGSDYQAPALRASYDAPQPALRVQSYDAPAPVFRSSNYEAPAARVVDVPTVRIEMNHEGGYEAPALKSNYEAPALKSSYDAPAFRVQSYDAPAPATFRSSY